MPEVFESDVLIIGGGIAGCVAAVKAAEAGASVLLVDKTRNIRRTGDAGRGLAFLTTWMDTGEDWDTPEAYAKYYCDIALGLVDMEVAWPMGVEPLPHVLRFLEESGVPMRNSDGGYTRVGRMWTPGPIVLQFDGRDIMPRLSERAKAMPGVRVVGGIQVTSVLQDESGRAVGATGFDSHTCEFMTFKAGAVVLATGVAERVIFNSPRRDPFNTYHRPYHAATGYALAARAGAAISSIEFLGTFLFPRGFANGAMSNLLEAGARLVNGHGDLIANLPDVEGERRFGHGIVAKAVGEILNGRGPVYFDMTHLPASKLADLETYISYDSPLFREFVDQSNIDMAHNPIEFEVFNGVWSADGSPKGVVIDKTGMTRTPGLFAIGDLATPVYALPGSLSSGYVVGTSAAAYARGSDAPVLVGEAVTAERHRVLAPLERKTGIGWREFEWELQHVMTTYVGMSRNELGLRQAQLDLASFRDIAGTVKASGGHELMRTHEALDLQFFDEMMATVALERDESRFSYLMGHYRSDYPNPDNEKWVGVALLASYDGEHTHVERTVPTPAWRADRLANPRSGTGKTEAEANLQASNVPDIVVRTNTASGKVR